MSATEKQASVSYPEAIPALSNAHSSTVAVRKFETGMAASVHVFEGARYRGASGEVMVDEILEYLKELHFGDPFPFVIDANGGQSRFEAILAGYDLNFYPSSDRFNLTIITVPHFMKLSIAERTRAHQSDRKGVDEIAKLILEEYGLKVTHQPTIAVGEFSTLIQARRSDLQFIWHDLLARSGGDWHLFSPDGKDVWFANPTYKAERYNPSPLNLLKVIEGDMSFDAVGMGGSRLTKLCFNPYDKTRSDGFASPGMDLTAYGSVASFDAFYNFQAAKLGTDSISYTNAHASPFVVQLRHVSPDFITAPSIIDLSGTGYRSEDNRQGSVRAITYAVKSKSLSVSVLARRISR